jgi:hypothetical protein
MSTTSGRCSAARATPSSPFAAVATTPRSQPTRAAGGGRHARRRGGRRAARGSCDGHLDAHAGSSARDRVDPQPAARLLRESAISRRPKCGPAPFGMTSDPLEPSAIVEDREPRLVAARPAGPPRTPRGFRPRTRCRSWRSTRTARASGCGRVNARSNRRARNLTGRSSASASQPRVRWPSRSTHAPSTRSPADRRRQACDGRRRDQEVTAGSSASGVTPDCSTSATRVRVSMRTTIPMTMTASMAYGAYLNGAGWS